MNNLIINDFEHRVIRNVRRELRHSEHAEMYLGFTPINKTNINKYVSEYSKSKEDLIEKGFQFTIRLPYRNAKGELKVPNVIKHYDKRLRVIVFKYNKETKTFVVLDKGLGRKPYPVLAEINMDRKVTYLMDTKYIDENDIGKIEKFAETSNPTFGTLTTDYVFNTKYK